MQAERSAAHAFDIGYVVDLLILPIQSKPLVAVGSVAVTSKIGVKPAKVAPGLTIDDVIASRRQRSRIGVINGNGVVAVGWHPGECGERADPRA